MTETVRPEDLDGAEVLSSGEPVDTRLMWGQIDTGDIDAALAADRAKADASDATSAALGAKAKKPRGRKKKVKSGDESEEAETEDGNIHLPPVARDLGYDVHRMNERYALVLVGSKPAIIDENPHAPRYEYLTLRSLEAFHAWHSNKLTEIIGYNGRLKMVTQSDRWMSDRYRREYNGMVFFPNPDGAQSPIGYYNMWRGFSCKPIEKYLGYKTLKDHILNNLCLGDMALYMWVFGWFAHIVQRPRERVGTALVMRGKMGAGKSFLGEVIGSLFEAHYFMVDDPRYVTGQFNAHMASCLLLQAEEAVWAGDKAAEGRLKGLITSKFQMIEAKGVDPIRIDNYVRLIMTSNEDWVVPAGKDERRFCVLDISDRVAQNHGYFQEMMEELDNGGREALLHDLLMFDLSQVNLRQIPKTSGLLEQKIRSLTSTESWWFERLQDGKQIRKVDVWQSAIDRDAIHRDYIEQSDIIGIKRRATQTDLGATLRKLVPTIQDVRPWVTTETGSRERSRRYIFPSLEECRMMFEEAVGQPVDWHDTAAQESRDEGVDSFGPTA